MHAIVPRLLLIDDDHRLAQMLVAYLERNGMQAEHAGTAEAGLRRLRTGSAARSLAAVVLDLMLPDADGLDVCRTIRTLPSPVADIPVLMLTAKGDPMDRVVGLELGADDYLPKPFEPRELLARLRALLRRPRQQRPTTVLRFGDLEIDREGRSVRVGHREVALTSRQFDLLVALAERAGRVLSREQLSSAVGTSSDSTDRAIDVHIGRLRAAIERDPHHPRHIVTVRGAGYCFTRSATVGHD